MIDKQVARGIAREKTRESLAVLMALAAALLAWAIGAASEGWIGVLVMLALFAAIWRFYAR